MGPNTMRYSTKHGPSKRRNALANPVAKAIAARQITQHLRQIQVLAYLLQDGEECADRLAHMAWVIGLGCEVAFSIQHPRARFLHGALRTVHAMALAGYRWQGHAAPQVDTALAESDQLITGHAETAWTMVAGAEWLAHRITTRTTMPGDVAGAELYAPPAAPAPEKSPPLAPPALGGGGDPRQTAGEVDQEQQAAARPEGLVDSALAGAEKVMVEGAAEAAPGQSSRRIVWLSGDANPLQLGASDRRFMVVEGGEG